MRKTWLAGIVFFIATISCARITYCWQCESHAGDKIDYVEICNKTESEIRQFEKDYSHPGPMIATMKCKLKVN